MTIFKDNLDLRIIVNGVILMLFKGYSMRKKILPVVVLSSLTWFVISEIDRAVTAPVCVTQKELNYHTDTLYVNMQEVMGNCLQGKQAQKLVETEEIKYTELAQKEQQRMMSLDNDIRTKGSLLNADERRKMETEFATLERDFKNKMQDWRNELQYTMQSETDKMIKEIEQAAKILAENNDKAVVKDVPTGRVLYLRDDRNSTNDMIALLDNQYTMKFAHSKDTPKAIKA